VQSGQGSGIILQLPKRSDGWSLNYKLKAGYTQNCNVDRSTAPWVDSGKCSPAFALIYTLYVSRIILSSMESAKKDLLQGTLDMLILKALALDSMHGLGFSNNRSNHKRDI
jgi:hypothetical protein